MVGAMSRARVRKEDIIDALRGEAMIDFISSLGHNPIKREREWKILCPFHSDSNPSFGINPNKKPEKGGIFKCFPCGWSGSVFDFVQQTQGLEDFKSSINFIAGKLGMGGGKVRASGAAIVKREVVRRDEQKVLTPEEVDADYREWMKHEMDPRPHAERLGLRHEGLEILGGAIVNYRGKPVIMVPQRNQLGMLYSLRFRSLGPKKMEIDSHGKPKVGADGKVKMKTVRWSLARRDGDIITHISRGALMAPTYQFEETPKPGQSSMVVEGETDVWAGVSMMLDAFGPPPWPILWYALPGVTSCHDMLVPEILGPSTCLFFDPDQAGRSAVFDHRMHCKDQVTGGMRLDLDRPPKEGLMRTLRNRGVSTVAAFAPTLADGGKQDLRDIYGLRWTWERLEDHIMRTARGLR